MSTTRRRLGCTVAAFTMLACMSAPAEAATRFATEARTTSVSAHGDRVVWSSYDAARDRYRLMVRINGITSRVPVAPRREAFDADLGPDGRGRPVIVYSRCRRQRSALPPRPNDGCALYRFSWSTGREARLDHLAQRGSATWRPSIWGRSIVFARTTRGDSGLRTQIASAGMRRGSRVRLLGRALSVAGTPAALDLRARSVGVLWRTEPGRCGPFIEGELNSPERFEIWSLPTSGRDPTQIESLCGPQADFQMAGVVRTATAVTYSLSSLRADCCGSRQGSFIRQFRIDDRTYRSAMVQNSPVSVSATTDAVYYARRVLGEGSRTELIEAADLRFERSARASRAGVTPAG